MWKTTVFCGSLFGGAALGLAAVARWIEPAAMPAISAIGLSLIGVALILAAPAVETPEELEEAPIAATLNAPVSQPLRAITSPSGSVKALDVTTSALTPLEGAQIAKELG
jgi:hypothetical protein